jgi:hypothetical protein
MIKHNIKKKMTMDTDNFFNDYLNDALSISALCSDLGLSQDDAKLFTYIHVKSLNSPDGITCFDKSENEEINALEIMLGMKKFSPTMKDVSISDDCEKTIRNFGNELSDCIKNLDFIASEGCGLESYFKAELMRRLRFHQDPDYRKEKLHLYVTEIFPRVKEYTKNKVIEVFERDRNEERIVLNFRDSLN